MSAPAEQTGSVGLSRTQREAKGGGDKLPVEGRYPLHLKQRTPIVLPMAMVQLIVITVAGIFDMEMKPVYYAMKIVA